MSECVHKSRTNKPCLQDENKKPKLWEISFITRSKSNSNLKTVTKIIFCKVFDCNILPNWDPILNPALFSCSYKKQSGFEYPSSAREYSHSLSDSYRLRNKPNIESVCPQKSLFEVTGYEVMADADGKNHMKQFKYLTKNVVLATGRLWKEIYLIIHVWNFQDKPICQTSWEFLAKTCLLFYTIYKNWRKWLKPDAWLQTLTRWWLLEQGCLPQMQL